MRISSRAIIFKDDSIILIYRESKHGKYYVFPGGGQEDFENKEECIIRECMEELGINVEIIKQLYEVKGDGIFQNFFLCNWVNGEIGTGDEEEYDPNRPTGLQIPMLVKIEDMKNLNIISPDIVKEFLIDYDKYGKIMNDKLKVIIEK